MVIDGVKIIDSDSGYDIYNNITERYKDGEDVEKIRQDWLNEETNFCIVLFVRFKDKIIGIVTIII